ncbi:MAG: hypothetical protein WC069_06690 [Candidatus Shapirobacteria bacterium]
MTDKQLIFKDYLLKRLGFKNNDFTNEYIEYLSEIVFIHKEIAAIDIKDWDENNPKPFYKYDPHLDRFSPTRFSIIDFLAWEYKLKKENLFKLLEIHTDYVSATDLANYTYCPIGYSIGKTYKIPKNHLGDIGTKKHEEHRLIKFTKKPINECEKDYEVEKETPYNFFRNPTTKYFFDDIDSSELIFSGHSDINDTQFFINEEKKFIGQPDYIFKNKDGQYYVVEEKFKRDNNSNQNYFFRNNKIQLASYIYYLNQFNIDYGYLVYWLYNYVYSKVQVQDCKILKIDKSKNVEVFLFNAFDLVNAFNKEKVYNLKQSELSPKKCANCVYVLICGHKNQRINQVCLPYQQRYLNLFYAEYPSELKKNENEDN